MIVSEAAGILSSFSKLVASQGCRPACVCVRVRVRVHLLKQMTNALEDFTSGNPMTFHKPHDSKLPDLHVSEKFEKTKVMSPTME